VCLVVLGKHVPGLEFLSTLMAESPALSPDVSYYQRLLARDQSEAAEIIQRHIASQSTDTVYDALMLPALNYAERDRLEGRLTDAEEQLVIEQTGELLNDVKDLQRTLRGASGAVGPASAESPSQVTGAPVDVIGYAANGLADAVALKMLSQLVDADRIRLQIPSVRLLSAELVDLVQTRKVNLVCIADLPPSPPSKTRYLVRKLRAALPDVKILVGRWAPPQLADDDRTILIDGGANHVAPTLIETRDHLRTLVVYERARSGSSSPDPASADGSSPSLAGAAQGMRG
jgi:hypothetical protein